MTKEDAWRFARQWIGAWNAHDLAAVMAHYDEAVELTSPVAAERMGRPGGKISGRADVQAYFQTGLRAFPDLRFDLDDVLWGVSSIVLYFRNWRGTHTAEFMELSPAGKVIRVVANYSG